MLATYYNIEGIKKKKGFLDKKNTQNVDFLAAHKDDASGKNCKKVALHLNTIAKDKDFTCTVVTTTQVRAGADGVKLYASTTRAVSP